MIKLTQDFLEWCRDNRVRDVKCAREGIAIDPTNPHERGILVHVTKISFFDTYGMVSAVSPSPAPVEQMPNDPPAARPLTDDDVLFWSAQPSTTAPKIGGEQ